MRILPKTRTGKASVILIVVMFALFILGMRFFSGQYASAAAGETILSDLLARPGLAVSMLAGFVSGIAAFIVGLAAIVTYKERAILSLVATFIGALLTIFILSELILPH